MSALYLECRPRRAGRSVYQQPFEGERHVLEQGLGSETPRYPRWCSIGMSCSRFIEWVLAASLVGDVKRIVYTSPSVGEVETGWDLDFKVGGRTIVTGNYPRFDNPYCKSAFDFDEIMIRCGGFQFRIAG